MNITEYNVKDTTKCECGYQFDIHDINGLQIISNHGFYSNIVRTCSQIHCPKCKRETVLLLKQKGQTWEILGIATPKVEEKPIQAIKPAKKQETPKKQATTIENKTVSNSGNEFICLTCKKVCKSRIGLNAHMKTHNK